MKQIFFLCRIFLAANSLEIGSMILFDGSVSPVKLDSSTAMSIDSNKRKSAGTRSPVFKIIMSPGTRSLARRECSSPFLKLSFYLHRFFFHNYFRKFKRDKLNVQKITNYKQAAQVYSIRLMPFQTDIP